MTQYTDSRTKFFKEVIKRVDYLSMVTEDILYELIFSFDHLHFLKDDPVLDIAQTIDSIYFIERGTI